MNKKLKLFCWTTIIVFVGMITMALLSYFMHDVNQVVFILALLLLAILISVFVTSMLGFVRRQYQDQRYSIKELIDEDNHLLIDFPEQNPSPVFRLDTNGCLIFHNKACAKYLDAWQLRNQQQDNGSWQILAQSVLKTAAIKQIEMDGGDKTFLLNCVPIPAMNYVNVYCADISVRKKHESTLEHLASHDAVTSLPMRVLFEDLLNKMIEWANGDGDRVILCVLHITGFAALHKTLEPKDFDLLLQQVTKRIQVDLPKQSTVGRLSENEFAIAIAGFKELSEADSLILQLLNRLNGLYNLIHNKVNIHFSMGIAASPDDSQDANLLLKYASLASYYAGTSQSEPYKYYQTSMNKNMQYRHKIQTALISALDQEQFTLQYQPQFDLNTHRVCGFEVLLRWHHPDLGWMPAADFIPIAEDSGIIVPLGDWIMQKACDQVLTWQQHYGVQLRASINLSAIQFRQKDLHHRIALLLERSNINPKLFELEITESAFIEEFHEAVDILNKLNLLGIQIAIDDFGTGYSSLSYLKQLPVHRLKIDKMFISDLPSCHESVAIVGAIINLGKNLGLNTIAEGVETEQQLQIVKNLGCNEVQGYYFSEPLTAEQFEKIITQYIA